MSELPALIPPALPEKAKKIPRKIKREKYVKTITLFEMKEGQRVETKIPATTDAAKVLRAITAEKARQKLEEKLEKELTAKEYRDIVESLKTLSEIDKQEGPPPSKPGNVTLNNSVIAAPGAGEDVAALLGAVANAATATKKAEPVVDIPSK